MENSIPAKPWASLFVCVAICVAVGGVASWITASSVSTWYPTLEKPSWTPPGYLFGPVWSALYVMMGFALWYVWSTREGTGRRRALWAFAIQLTLNGLWSFVFFGFRWTGWAALEIAALWVAIVVTIVLFSRVHRAAAWLLVPYLAWVSYAGALNTKIWLMN